MVPPRRRLAQQVSYRESDSEDEEQDDSFADSSDGSPEPRPRTRRTKPKVPVVSAESNTAVQRRRLPRKTYTEDFTETDNDSDFSSDERIDVDEHLTVAAKTKAVRIAPSKPRGRPARRTGASVTASPRMAAQRRAYDPPTSPPPFIPWRRGT
jgi:hypothetical protein